MDPSSSTTDPRKTILLISPYWHEEHRWMVSSVKLAELWQRLGFRVVVACMGSESSVEEISETLVIHRKKDVFLPDPLNFGIALGFTSFVRRIVREENPDLIVVNKVLFWSSFCTIPLRLSGRRILLLTDALVGMTWWPRSFLPKLIMGLGAWTVGWLVLLCAQRVVFFHPQPQRLLRLLGIAGKTEVIPTGIDASAYAPVVRDPSKVVVTYVGRLESVKGVDDFLAAVTPLAKEQPSLVVQVVGWYKEGHPLVERYASEVVFTGLREDVPAILAASDIFVLPSHSEGLSNALMEAMASGCACIASDVGGNRFLVEDGASGFLFPVGDRVKLKTSLSLLLGDRALRERLGTAARERIATMFDWTIVGDRYRVLFSSFGS